MEEILLLASIVTVLVSAFVELVKITFNINKRFLPITALLTGIVVASLAFFLEVDLASRLWAGAIAGLSAVGLFENLKNTKGDKAGNE